MAVYSNICMLKEDNMDSRVKKFIEENIELIEQNKFDELYYNAEISLGFLERMTQVFLDSGIDPLPYMNHVVPLMYQATDIESIVIPDNIKYLPSRRAFSECNNLVHVSVPPTLLSFGYETFYKCPNLHTIEFRGTSSKFLANNSKPEEWAKGSNVTKVVCSDGVITLRH